MKLEREHVTLVLVATFVICTLFNFARTWETCNKLDALEASVKGLSSRTSALLRKLALEQQSLPPVDADAVAKGLESFHLKSLSMHREHLLTQLYFLSTQLGLTTANLKQPVLV